MTDNKSSLAIPATIEALSTMHQPYGLMQTIVQDAPSAGRRVIHWCLLDVLETCTRDSCRNCVLEEDCQGLARKAQGFLRIDDAIRMKQRVSKETWEAEMLCLRPSRANCVFPTFSETAHIREDDFWNGQIHMCRKTLAVDFGFTHPFVCLWILSDAAGRAFVSDEYVVTQRTTASNAQAIRSRHPGFHEVRCDPAGGHANAQTGNTDINILRSAGLDVRCRRSAINEGLEQIRTALSPALGEPTLRIHPRCKELIKSMRQYHYRSDAPGENPHKDDINDHCVDALRYYYINQWAGKIGVANI